MQLADRACLYNSAFPKWPSLFYDKGWLIGYWSIGACYKGNGFYGQYPYKYLDRIMSMFPDKKNILHLFSGSLQPGNYTRVDINVKLKPDIVADAEHFSEFTNKKFDLILADPPYQHLDAEKYGYKLPNKGKVMHQCFQVASPGAHLVWLDERLPMHKKTEWKQVGGIGIQRSTNHRVRCAFIFERQ